MFQVLAAEKDSFPCRPDIFRQAPKEFMIAPSIGKEAKENLFVSDETIDFFN